MIDEGSGPGPLGPRGGRPRILVVDDEIDILRAFRRMLPGHEVVAAAGGPDAVAILQQDDDFDALVLDVMMPDIDGRQLYLWIAAERPRLLPRILFCTGGIFSRSVEEWVRSVQNPLLLKPVALADLLAVLAPLTGRSTP